MKHFSIPLCGLAILLSSCDYDVYQIKLTPQGDTVVRELTVFHVSQGQPATAPTSRPASRTAATLQTPASTAPTTAAATASTQRSQISADKLQAIQKLYPKTKSAPDDAQQVFVAEFKGKMPSDVGGAGTYTRLPSELGDSFFYLERFRGNEHPGLRLSEMNSAVDQLVDLLIGWFSSELSKEPGYQALHEYMDKDFRAQLKDLNVFYAMSEADLQAKGANDEIAARAAQYVFESDLFTPQEFAGLVGGPNSVLGEPSQRKLLRMLQTKAARKMGVAEGKPLPKSLLFLEYGYAGESFDKYVESTKEFKDFQREHAQTQPGLPVNMSPTAQRAFSQPATQPTTHDFIGEKFKPLMPVLGGDGRDQLVVQLQLPSEPLKTNGLWKPDAKTVDWEAFLSDPESPVWPRLFYAVWTTPDTSAQLKLFGSVILQGQDLVDYCTARSAMTADESQKWTQSLSKMSEDLLKDQAKQNETPAQTLLRLLKESQEESFRTSTQPTTQQRP